MLEIWYITLPILPSLPYLSLDIQFLSPTKIYDTPALRQALGLGSGTAVVKKTESPTPVDFLPVGNLKISKERESIRVVCGNERTVWGAVRWSHEGACSKLVAQGRSLWRGDIWAENWELRISQLSWPPRKKNNSCNTQGKKMSPNSSFCLRSF